MLGARRRPGARAGHALGMRWATSHLVHGGALGIPCAHGASARAYASPAHPMVRKGLSAISTHKPIYLSMLTTDNCKGLPCTLR